MAGLVLINALYVGAEFGVIGVRRSRIRQLAGEGSRLARWLLPRIDTPAELNRCISASQIGITLSGLLLGAFAQSSLAPALTPMVQGETGLTTSVAASISVAIVLVLVTGISTIFGELVPKTLALRFPTQVALYTYILLTPSRWVYRPFIALLNGTARLLLRGAGAHHLPGRHVHSPQEIALIIADSRDGGLLEADEHRHLQRALRLTQKTVRHLMVPRPRIKSVEVTTPPERLLEIVSSSPYSRLPVHQGGVDNIIGILRTKDVVRRFVEGGPTAAVSHLLQPMATVPDSITIDRLLRVLRDQRVHVALVIDEHGGTAGLVTLEDVLADLLGDVGDEYKSVDPSPEQLGSGRWRLPGALSVADAAALVGNSLDVEATTVGGLVVTALGRLPVPGDMVEFCGFDWRVEETVGHRVASVVVSRPETDAPEKLT
jgi:putative hemolysin